MKTAWKIVIMIIGIVLLIALFFGYKGYEKSKTIGEMMPLRLGGDGMCNKICIEQGYSNGCFIPSSPECVCDGVNIEDYSYCEEEN